MTWYEQIQLDLSEKKYADRDIIRKLVNVNYKLMQYRETHHLISKHKNSFERQFPITEIE